MGRQHQLGPYLPPRLRVEKGTHQQSSIVQHCVFLGGRRPMAERYVKCWEVGQTEGEQQQEGMEEIESTQQKEGGWLTLTCAAVACSGGHRVCPPPGVAPELP